jgi:hypothetical protein
MSDWQPLSASLASNCALPYLALLYPLLCCGAARLLLLSLLRRLLELLPGTGTMANVVQAVLLLALRREGR